MALATHYSATNKQDRPLQCLFISQNLFYFIFLLLAEPIVDHTAAENVVVPESGEESEDEWNYIKVQKEEAIRITPSTLITDIDVDNNETEEFADHSQSETAAKVEELHAVSQALAESQEACVEVQFLRNFFNLSNLIVSLFRYCIRKRKLVTPRTIQSSCTLNRRPQTIRVLHTTIVN